MMLSIWNTIVEPIDIAFNPPTFNDLEVVIFISLINLTFAIDIIFNFMCAYIDPYTGEEILDYKKIAINYLRGIFWIDFLSVIPFELILGDFTENKSILKSFSLLKMFRVLRLNKFITYLNQNREIKTSLRIMKLCFFLIVYIHLTGCIWIYMNNFVPEH